jgi:hypothetical protein
MVNLGELRHDSWITLNLSSTGISARAASASWKKRRKRREKMKDKGADGMSVIVFAVFEVAGDRPQYGS